LEVDELAEKFNKIISEMRIFKTMNVTILGQKVDALENKLDNFIETIEEKMRIFSEFIGITSKRVSLI